MAYYWQPTSPGYYGPNPHVYMPPGYPPVPAWPTHVPDHSQAYRSTKYPQLHPILAIDTSVLRWDIGKEPRREILAATYNSTKHVSALAYPVPHIRLISKSFPWTIDIKMSTPVTCEAIWDGLHKGLQVPLADSEWGMVIASGDDKQRDRIEKAAKKRATADGEKNLKRIDWLGDHVMFKGLEKNETFEKARLMPGIDPCTETWVVKLGT